MDENLSAVLIAAITAGFGFLGVLATQFLSKAKARQLKQKDAIESLVSEGSTVDLVDHIMNLSAKIRENGMVAREGIQGLKEDIFEVKADVREIKSKLDQRNLL